MYVQVGSCQAARADMGIAAEYLPRTFLNVQVADLVKELRKAQGWTQEQLANRAGLRRTEINRIERAKNQASSVAIRQALAKGFEMTLEHMNDFLDGQIGLKDARGMCGETRHGAELNPLEQAIARLGNLIWPAARDHVRQEAAGREDSKNELGWVQELIRRQKILAAQTDMARDAERQNRRPSKPPRAPKRRAV